MSLQRIRVKYSRRGPCVVYVGNYNPLSDTVVKSWDPREIAVISGDPGTRDLFRDLNGSRHVVSRRMSDLLTELVPHHVQFLPVQLQTCDGEQQFDGYSILRLMCRIDSTTMQVTGDELGIFRPPMGCDPLVTPSLFERLRKAGLDGVDFIRRQPRD